MKVAVYCTSVIKFLVHYEFFLCVFVLCLHVHFELRTTRLDTNLNLNNEDCLQNSCFEKGKFRRTERDRGRADFTSRVLCVRNPLS
jgi:hypothetical protein